MESLASFEMLSTESVGSRRDLVANFVSYTPPTRLNSEIAAIIRVLAVYRYMACLLMPSVSPMLVASGGEDYVLVQ